MTMRNSEFLKLRDLDFNLLKTLAILLDQKHVSKSAGILCLSQSAVSKQLNKLRRMFDDPLMVRVGNQQILTPKASRIQPQVNFLCEQIRDLILPEKLNLEEIVMNVSIICSDYAGPQWMNTLIQEVNREAPNVTICCKTWSDDNVSKLISGDINIALGPLSSLNNLCENEIIGQLTTSMIASENHPIFNNPQEDVYLALHRYPLLRIRGNDDYKEVYSKFVPNNQVLIDEISLWLALESLKTTDAIMMGPSMFIDTLAKDNQFKALPLDKIPLVPIAVSWTSGLMNDTFYRWFIDKVLNIGRRYTSEVLST